MNVRLRMAYIKRKKPRSDFADRHGLSLKLGCNLCRAAGGVRRLLGRVS